MDDFDKPTAINNYITNESELSQVSEEDEELLKCNFYDSAKNKFMYGKYIESIIDDNGSIEFKIKDYENNIKCKDVRLYNQFRIGEECLLKDGNSWTVVKIKSNEDEKGIYSIGHERFSGMKNTNDLRSIVCNDLYELKDYVEIKNKKNINKRGFIVSIIERNEEKRYKILLENMEILSKLEKNISYPKFYICEDVLYLDRKNHYTPYYIRAITSDGKYILSRTVENEGIEVTAEEIVKKNNFNVMRGDIVCAKIKPGYNDYYYGKICSISYNGTYSIYFPEKKEYCENLCSDFILPPYFYTDIYYFFIGQIVLFDSYKEGTINDYDAVNNIVMLRCCNGDYFRIDASLIKPKLPNLGEKGWYFEDIGDGKYNFIYSEVKEIIALNNIWYLFNNCDEY